MNSDLVPWHSLAGEITIPRGVVAVIVGEIGSSDKEADRHSVWGSVNIMRQAWENEKLLTNAAIREMYENCKAELCAAIRDMDDLLFERIAEALKAEKKRQVLDCRRAIAYAFINLRYKYKNAKIPTEELKQETQSEWAQSRDEPFRKPNWSRDFEALGITEDFVIPEKRGRKIRKPN
jgi:hypothetical protein